MVDLDIFNDGWQLLLPPLLQLLLHRRCRCCRYTGWKVLHMLLPLLPSPHLLRSCRRSSRCPVLPRSMHTLTRCHWKVQLLPLQLF
jgi:hypothetical protein